MLPVVEAGTTSTSSMHSRWRCGPERTVAELLDEVRSNLARDIAAVEKAPDELLSKQFKAPWDVEGPVADVIVEHLKRHFRGHLAELAAALR